MDPPKRERKRVVNYAENEYYRQAMKTGGGPRASGLRLPKMPQLQASRPSPAGIYKFRKSSSEKTSNVIIK